MQAAAWFGRLLPPASAALPDRIGIGASITLIRAGAWARVVFSSLSAVIAIPFAPPAFLTVWVAFFLVWELAIRPALEDRVAREARDDDAGFQALAAINFVGGVAYCTFPVVVWSSGDTAGLLLAVAWVCGAAAHNFVYFTARRVLLMSCIGPLIGVALAAPLSSEQPLSPLSLVGVAVLIGVVAVNGFAGFDRREVLRELAASGAAQRAAEDASAAKTRFLALASHELRTPLNAIIGYGEMIAEAKDTHAEDAARVLAAAHRLLDLVNGMLDVSRLEAGLVRLEVTRAPVATLLQDLREAGEPIAAAKGNRFTVRAEGELGDATLDRARLRQCLMHLVENAARFTENGEIDVTAVHGAGAGRLEFRIRDTGAGIAPERLAQLFEPLAGADHGGGTCLRLASARLNARLMGGDLVCESRSGEGATFTLWVAAG